MPIQVRTMGRESYRVKIFLSMMQQTVWRVLVVCYRVRLILPFYVVASTCLDPRGQRRDATKLVLSL